MSLVDLFKLVILVGESKERGCKYSKRKIKVHMTREPQVPEKAK